MLLQRRGFSPPAILCAFVSLIGALQLANASGDAAAGGPAAAVPPMGWVGTAAKKQEFESEPGLLKVKEEEESAKLERYHFTPEETARLMNFFISNLRPWKEQIPQELIEFLKVRLEQRDGAAAGGAVPTGAAENGNVDNPNADGANPAENGEVGEEQSKKGFHFDFLKFLTNGRFKLGKKEEKQKKKEAKQKKKKQEKAAADGGPSGGKGSGRKSTLQNVFTFGHGSKPKQSATLGTLQEGVEAAEVSAAVPSQQHQQQQRMTTVAFADRSEGAKVLGDISEPLDDLLASVIVSEPIADVLALFGAEIAQGQTKGYYSEEAVRTLRKVAALFNERMDKRLVPSGTFRLYYGHTMLYQYFLTLFTRYVDGLKANAEKEKESSDYKVEAFLNSQLFVLQDEPAEPFDMAFMNAQVGQLKYLGQSTHKDNALDRLASLVQIAQEIGLQTLCDYRDTAGTNRGLLQLLESTAACAEQLGESIEIVTDNVPLPLITASMQKLKAEVLKFKQLEEERQKQTAALAASKSPVQLGCVPMLRELGMLLKVFKTILEVTARKSTRVLGPLSRIAAQVPYTWNFNKRNWVLDLVLVSAFQEVLDQHKVKRHYEEPKLSALLERIRAHRSVLLGLQWYGVTETVRKDQERTQDENNKAFEAIVQQVQEVGSWIAQSESHRHLEAEKAATEGKIASLSAAYQQYTSANTQQRVSTKGMAEFNAEVDAALNAIHDTMQQLISGNTNAKEVEKFRAVAQKVAEYRKIRTGATALYNKWMKKEEKERWQGLMVEAKRSGDWKVVQETLKIIQQLEADRRVQMELYTEIMDGMEQVTTMDGQKYGQILNEEGMAQLQRLERFKQLLQETAKLNGERMKPKLSRPLPVSNARKEQLRAQNEKIEALVAKIDQHAAMETEITTNKERAVELNLEAHDLDGQHVADLNGEINSVQNYFMLQRLLNKEHMENIEAYNAHMEALAKQKSQLVLALKLLKDGFAERLQLLDILTKSSQFDDDDEQPASTLAKHYGPILETMRRNQKEQREVLYEFFNNDIEDTVDIISLSYIQPTKKDIFDTRFTLAESASMIEWLSTVKFDTIDLLNNPTSIIDLLMAKLNVAIATVQRNVKEKDPDFLADFARDPVKNQDPQEYYRQQIIGRNTNALPLSRLRLLQRPLQAAILTLMAMNERLLEMAASAEKPTEFYHQIAFVDIPIKLYIPLTPKDRLSRGKFLLYTLFTFGESLVEQFKSEQLAINRLLAIGQDQLKEMHQQLRDQKLVKNSFKIPFVPFRTEEFERRFVENFVFNVFERYAFNEQRPSDGQEDAEENAIGGTSAALAPTKLGALMVEDLNNEFKRAIRQEMCHFVGITFDEQAEQEHIKLLDSTIKSLHGYVSRLSGGIPAPPPRPPLPRTAKRSKHVFNAVKFINEGAPLVQKARIAQSIWREYRQKQPKQLFSPPLDPVDKEFNQEVLDKLIQLYTARGVSNLIDNYAKAYIVYPYKAKRKGLLTVINLKELLKLNRKRVSSIKKKSKKQEAADAVEGEEAVPVVEENNANGGDSDAGELLSNVTEAVQQQQQQRRRRKRAAAQQPPAAAVAGTVAVPKKAPIAVAVDGANDVDNVPPIPYELDEFFDANQLQEIRQNPDSDPALKKIPPMAKPMYRLLRSLMMGTFNWELSNNAMQLEPMLKPTGFPDLDDFELYLQPDIDFRLLTDPLDQFCFIIAHSKQNVHMRIKVEYYENTALRTLIEMEDKLHAYSLVVDLLNQHQAALKKFLYRLLDYVNYINQFVAGTQHAYGFTLKSVTELLLKNTISRNGDILFRIADLIVEDFAAQGKQQSGDAEVGLAVLEQLVWMMKKMEKPFMASHLIKELESAEHARLEPKVQAISKKKGPKPAKKQQQLEGEETAAPESTALAIVASGEGEEGEGNPATADGVVVEDGNGGKQDNADDGKANKPNIKQRLVDVKLTGLKEIRTSIQNILQLRLNLLTEISEHTRDEDNDDADGNGEEVDVERKKTNTKAAAMTNIQRNNKNARQISIKKVQSMKDWRLSSSEAKQHRAILMNAYKERYHQLIRRLNNIWNMEKRLRDFYCFDSCHPRGRDSFDLTLMVQEFHKTFKLIKTAIAKYRERVKLEEAAKRREAKNLKNKFFQKMAANNGEEVKISSPKEYMEMLAKKKSQLNKVAQEDNN